MTQLTKLEIGQKYLTRGGKQAIVAALRSNERDPKVRSTFTVTVMQDEGSGDGRMGSRYAVWGDGLRAGCSSYTVDKNSDLVCLFFEPEVSQMDLFDL